MDNNHKNFRVFIISPYVANHGLSIFYQSAFQQIGCETYFEAIIPYTPWLSPWRKKCKSFLQRRLVFIRDIELKNQYERILKNIKLFCPDLVLIIQGDDVSSVFIERIRTISRDSKGPLVFLYYSDNPWVSANPPSYFWETIGLYDCIFTFAKFLIPHLYHAGSRRVEYLPFAYNPNIHFPQNSLTLMDNSIYKPTNVAYIGTWSSSTENWLRSLLPFGLKIWGNSWENSNEDIISVWQKPTCHSEGQGENMKYACWTAKIVVNFMRMQHLSGHSMKTFELPACGVFTLSTRTEEQTGFFPEGICADYFWTKDELINKVKYYLNNSDARMLIKSAALEKVKNHTYSNRAQYMLKILQEIHRGT